MGEYLILKVLVIVTAHKVEVIVNVPVPVPDLISTNFDEKNIVL